MNQKKEYTPVEQILSAAEEIQRNTRGGKANFIYAPEDAILAITDCARRKEQESRREEIENMLNRKHQ